MKQKEQKEQKADPPPVEARQAQLRGVGTCKKNCKADFAPSQVFRVSSVERLLP
jgi:hypothetical protein